jgi:Uma2 family endonuclease
MIKNQILTDRILRGSYIERMTNEEFFRFCQDNRDFKFEREANGQIVLMSPTHYLTGKQNNEILYQLTAWNKKRKLGECVDSDTGFYLSNGAMRNPDAAWISHQRLKEVSPKDLRSFLSICPNFIVELRSGSDSINELNAKMEEWINNGCLLGWLIDADEETVYIYRPGKEVEQHTNFDQPISGDPVLPEFSLMLSELRM